ncbi:UbiA prenyltransferase [Mycena kentingensis (nom. inval.)]|nr:UbiA prenyltransferase [Mycena kentingensis (nom. inval.)]
MAPSSVSAAVATSMPFPAEKPASASRSIQVLRELLAVPTRTEIEACWDLCRLNNNMGCWIVLLPTLWSITMAYHANPEISGIDALKRAALYVPLCAGVKSLIMTIDDILDADIDAKVTRTKSRAIPRGAISLPRAWLFFASQVVIGVYLAQRLLSRPALWVGCTRRCSSGQFFSSTLRSSAGVTLPSSHSYTSFPPNSTRVINRFTGYNVQHRRIHGLRRHAPHRPLPYTTLLPIFAGTFLWVVTYETIYQCADKADDAQLGIYSAARLCGAYTLPVTSTTAAGFLLLLVFGGTQNGHGGVFLAFVALAAGILFRSILRTDIDDPTTCLRMFVTTPLVGQVVLAGFVADAVAGRLRAGIPLY